MKTLTKQLLQCLMISMLLSKSAAPFTPRLRGKEKGKEVAGTSVSFEDETDAGPGPASGLLTGRMGKATVGTIASSETGAHSEDDNESPETIGIEHGLFTEEEERDMLEGSSEQRLAAFRKSVTRLMEQFSRNLDEEIGNQKKRLNGEPHSTRGEVVWTNLLYWQTEIKKLRNEIQGKGLIYYDEKFRELSGKLRTLRSMLTTLTQEEKEANQKSFLEGTVFARQNSSSSFPDRRRNKNKGGKNKPGHKRH